MALADNILAGARKAFHRVRIGFIPLIPFDSITGTGITDIRYQESFNQPCPQVTIEMNRGEGWWIKNESPVEVNLGFNGLNRRVFTGTVQARPQPSVAKRQIDCAGELWKLVNSRFDEVRDVGGLTVAQAMVAIFADVGIVNYDVSAVPAYTLASDAVLTGIDGLAQLEELMHIDGLRVRETGSGQIIAARYEGAPSASYFRKYTTNGENIRILEGSLTEDPNWYLNQVKVIGARLDDGTDIYQIATLVSDTGRPRRGEFHIPLIWDNTKCLEAATRLQAEHGVVPQMFRFDVPLDPQLELGLTLGVEAPEYNVTGNWLIWEQVHSVAADRSTPTMRGGPEFSGTINVNPIAAFTFRAENQPLGAQRYTFVTLDGTGSYQPDNSAEVLTYDWSGDQDAADSPAIDSQATAGPFTIQIDPTAMSGDVLTVTLTVTNAAGLTSTVVHEINITPEGTDAIVVGIAAALKTRFAFSGDGGENWNFQTGTDITSCALAPAVAQKPSYGVWGRDNGQIYRTTDGLATAPTSVKASNSIAIVDIKWDWRDPLRVWALDAQCQLWLSSDEGATWVEIVDWRTSMALSTIIGKRLFLHQDGYTYVGGGTGVVGNGRPFIGRFKSGESPFGFASVFGGNLSTDLGSGATALAIADWHFDTTGGLIIVLENYTAYNSGVRPAYWVPDPMVPTGWKRIGSTEGLDSGVTTAGRVALPANAGPGYFHLMFNDRDAWHINTSSGTPVATVTADFLDAGFTPNEGLWLADETEGMPSANCHILAVQDAAGNGAIIKSFDDMVTQADILPGMTAWPVVGAQGKDVAIGPAGQLATAAKIIIGGLLSTPTERFIAWRSGQGNFTAHIFPANLDADDFFHLRAITADLWFGFWATTASETGHDTVDAVRTEDGGATWDDLFAAPAGLTRAWQDINRAADGRLWGVTCEVGTTNHVEVWYSDDSGDTWTESYDSTVANNRIYMVLCDPLNPNRIYALGHDAATGDEMRGYYTITRGASWIAMGDFDINSSLTGTDGGNALGAMALPSHRLIRLIRHPANSHPKIFVSNDNGVTWTNTKEWSDSSNMQSFGPVGDPLGNRLFVMVTDRSLSPDDIQIWESNDQGATWTQTVGAALGNKPPQPDTADYYIGGLAYDPTEGALYLYGAGRGNADNVAQVVKTVGLGWQDVSDALISSLTGHTTYNIQDSTTRGIQVIPS